MTPTNADNFYGEAISQFKICNFKEARKAIKQAIKIIYPPLKRRKYSETVSSKPGSASKSGSQSGSKDDDDDGIGGDDMIDPKVFMHD